MKILKIAGIAVVVIAAFFWTTNPTMSDFKNYIPSTSRSLLKYEKAVFAKKVDKFFYSVYQYKIINTKTDHVTQYDYTGWGKNFELTNEYSYFK